MWRWFSTFFEKAFVSRVKRRFCMRMVKFHRSMYDVEMYFVIGMPLIVIFAAGLGWFPTSGMQTVGVADRGFVDGLIDLARHLALPLVTVSLGLIGQYSILMRSAIIETRAEDYITTARAKGLPDGLILRTHAFPNAMLPMVTLIALNLGYVIAGAITAEVVFSWPGCCNTQLTSASAARNALSVPVSTIGVSISPSSCTCVTPINLP